MYRGVPETPMVSVASSSENNLARPNTDHSIQAPAKKADQRALPIPGRRDGNVADVRQVHRERAKLAGKQIDNPGMNPAVRAGRRGDSDHQRLAAPSKRSKP